MRIGNENYVNSKVVTRWCNAVAVQKSRYVSKNGEKPDCISVPAQGYLELCAAAGGIVKYIHDLKVVVNWGQPNV